jgi:hypothetical protein
VAEKLSPALADLPTQSGSCRAVHEDPVTHQTGKWTIYVFDLASPTRRVTFTLRDDGAPQSFRAFAVVPPAGDEVRVMATFTSRGDVLEGSEAVTAPPTSAQTKVTSLGSGGKEKVSQLIKDIVKRCKDMPNVL